MRGQQRLGRWPGCRRQNAWWEIYRARRRSRGERVRYEGCRDRWCCSLGTARRGAPRRVGGRVAGALCAEDCEGGVVGVAEALWAGASAVCDGAACEGGCATTEVTNNRRKTGKRPSATRFKARGRDSICLKGSSAPGILLKAIPSLRPPGHEVILARGQPKAIRSCLQWSERETPTGLCLLLQCVRWRACGFEDQMCIVEYRA